MAQQATKIAARKHAQEFHPYRNTVLAGGAAALLITIGLWTYTGASLPLSYLAAINCTAFLVMGFDKHAAEQQAGRVPELVLALWALLGGSLGCLAGMQLFRHKTQKSSFQFIFALVLIVQIFLLQHFREALPFHERNAAYELQAGLSDLRR